MSRVSRGVQSRNYRKKILKMAKGYRGRAKNCYTIAVQKVEKGLQYAYRDRRNQKREIRGLWIVRINAALRKIGLKYSTFFGMVSTLTEKNAAGFIPNRKMMADMAMNDESAFTNLVQTIQNEFSTATVLAPKANSSNAAR